jgi:hypothetical protein
MKESIEHHNHKRRIAWAEGQDAEAIVRPASCARTCERACYLASTTNVMNSRRFIGSLAHRGSRTVLARHGKLGRFCPRRV